MIRYVLGDEVPIVVECVTPSGVATAPDSAPTIQVVTAGGSVVIDKQIPPHNRNITGLFGHRLSLDSLFSAGVHYVRKQWTISGTEYTAPDVELFEVVAGGSTGGQIVSMAYIERPDADWIVSASNTGQIGLLRGPKI